MTALIIIGTYFAGVFGMWFWDAYIGFGFEYDTRSNPPLGLACALWPLFVPITLIACLTMKMDSVKENRLEKEKQQEKVRVAAQKELDIYMREVEEELRTVVRRAK